jgi:hypothetical protein
MGRIKRVFVMLVFPVLVLACLITLGVLYDEPMVRVLVILMIFMFVFSVYPDVIRRYWEWVNWD